MKFQSNSIFNGTITANSVADAGTNTDKFLVLNSSGVVTYRTAAELYADLGVGASSAAYTSVLKHPVKAGEAINKGQAVYVSSADGTNMIVTKASNTAESTSSKTIGLLETTLANNGVGNVVTEGLLAGLDTTGATNAGDPVWLGTSGNLIYGLANKPYAPAHLVFIGIVTRINANNGEIFVKVQNGFELREIHDVDLITTTPVNGHILGYNGTLWVNKTIAGWLGFTPVTNARTLTINGTAYDLSADRSWTVSSMIYPGAGIAVSTGTAWGTSITNNSANWDTAYTNRITSLTVTGSSGAATLVSNTLNIPTYTLTGLGGVATTRTLTINGTAYDLSADRSWTIDSTTAATRTIQKFTATSGQTTFTITGGYTVGMVDVYMNGVKLDNATDFTASNGTTVVLTTGALTNSIIEVYKFGSQFIPNNALRVVTSFTATAAQTTFTVNYSVGLIDVFYNGSCLAQSEYTATNGTSIILATACQVNDIVVVYAYSYSVGAYSGIGGSGTSGQVPYFTSSSVIASSPNHFWDATNNRLGIGTSSPAYTLDVSGTLRNTTSAYFGTTSGNIGLGTTTIDTSGGLYTCVTVDSATYSRYSLQSSGVAKGRFQFDATNVSLGTTATGGKLQLFTTAANAMEFLTNDTLRMTIAATGSASFTNTIFSTAGNNNSVIGSTSASTGWVNLIYGATSGANVALAMENSSGGDRAVGTLAYAGVLSTYTATALQLGTNNNIRMTITSGGDVLIGTTSSPSAYGKVTIRGTNAGLTIQDAATNNYRAIYSQSGSLYFYNGTNEGYLSTGGTWVNASDVTLKKDVKEIEYGIAEVMKLKPKWYRMIEDDLEQIGFIAQDVEEILPELVSTSQRGMKGLSYGQLTAVLTKAIQEQQTQIQELSKQNEELSNRLIKLESK